MQKVKVVAMPAVGGNRDLFGIGRRLRRMEQADAPFAVIGSGIGDGKRHAGELLLLYWENPHVVISPLIAPTSFPIAGNLIAKVQVGGGS